MALSRAGELLVERRICPAGFFAEAFRLQLTLAQINVDLGAVRQVIGDRAIDLFEAQHGKPLDDGLRGLAFQEGIHDGIEGDPRAAYAESAFLLRHIPFALDHPGRSYT